jgi:two-component system sensor histidine kinase KdpD
VHQIHGPQGIAGALPSQNPAGDSPEVGHDFDQHPIGRVAVPQGKRSQPVCKGTVLAHDRSSVTLANALTKVKLQTGQIALQRIILVWMPGVDNPRPNPEELLRKVQADERRESRGRLKIFLGYASRVGKSLRMFDEGRRRKERGQDVVVGALQSGVTPEIQEILNCLEVVPSIPARHAGRDYQSMDMSALFRRHPQVCLIDGLAYDNPPGSRNPHRWQDVSELLDRGIAVITAVNLQHIAEQQTAVEKITGKRAASSIPEAFLHEADEIEVVDAPPDALLDRRKDSALPDSRRLAELRELALLLAADVVDRQLQEYLDAHGVAARWGAQERILVCLTPRSNAYDMLRSGMRNKLRFHGALLAAYVEQPDLPQRDRELLDNHLSLAREMGAEVHSLKGGGDFVEAILTFAREQRITQLFLGHTGRPGRAWLARGPIDRLIDGAEGFDVRLFPHGSAL